MPSPSDTVANLTERVLPSLLKFDGKLSDIVMTNVGVWYSQSWSYQEDIPSGKSLLA